MPAYLESRVRANHTSHRRGHPWVLNLVAAAGSALVLTVTTFPYERGYMHWTPQSRELYVASVSGRVATLMRVGDYVHGAVFRKYPKKPPSMAESVAGMGPDYSGIIPIVREHGPGDFQLLLAHHWTYHTRKFVHMVLRNAALLSVVIAHAGLSIYTSSVQRFQISALESN